MMGGRPGAWRAALRIARRDAWRNKGRSALIAVMVALPVLLVSAVSVIYRSDELDPEDVVRVTVGVDAQARVTLSEPGVPIEQTVDGTSWGTDSETSEPVDGPAPDLQRTEAQLRALLPPRDTLVRDVRLPLDRAVKVDGRVLEADIREFDYTVAGVGGLVEQVSGEPPRSTGQVVVTEALSRHAGVAAGDKLTYTPVPGEAARTLDVVGVVGGVALIGNRSLIGRPGSLAPDTQPEPDGTRLTEPSWLVVGPDPVTWDEVLKLNEAGAAVTSRAVLADPPSPERVPYEFMMEGSDDERATLIGVGIVAGGLVLLQIALLAGPAIAVGARRNQRTLALVAASGAERRHLRAVVLATSGVIGFVSCLLAALLGVLLGGATVLLLRRYAEYEFVRVDVAVLDLLALVAVGGLTAVAAAGLPARQAARLDVVAALTGRRAQQAVRRRVPVAGLVIAVLGGAVAAFGAVRHQPLTTVMGIALGEIGLVTATGGIVALAARGARKLPISSRLALRDAARQRGRTAPAVAAVMAAIAGTVATSMYLAAQDRANRLTYQPQGAVGMVQLSFSDAQGPPDVDAMTAALRRALPVDQVAVATHARAGGGLISHVEPLPAPRPGCPPVSEFESTDTPEDPGCFPETLPGTLGDSGPGPLIDDGSTVAILTGRTDPKVRAALADGRVVAFNPRLIWPDGRVHLKVIVTPAASDGTQDVERTVALPAMLSRQTPRPSQGVVLPPEAAPKLGLRATPMSVVASTTRMPTEEEEERARAVAEEELDAAYLYLERGHQSPLAITLLVLAAASVVIALGGTFTAVGLAAAEGRADMATLAAVGASPTVRRRVAASQAGVIAGLGATLGLASGVFAGWSLIRLRQPSTVSEGGDTFVVGEANWHLTVPWLWLALIGVGVPLLAMAVGFVSTRSRLPMVRRLGQ